MNNLMREIVQRSLSKEWEGAKIEWALYTVRISNEYSTCLCGHYLIKELCTIRNKMNNNRVMIGNCCVKKFLKLPSGKIIDAVKRVKEDISLALNQETIEHAREKGWINEWEQSFYTDTWRKRVLTGKQAVKRYQINKKILEKINR